MTEPARPEEVDVEFNLWFNRAQPLQQILRTAGHISRDQLLAVREELKQAFVHGYAKGIAAEVARPDPDNEPSPGLTT